MLTVRLPPSALPHLSSGALLVELTNTSNADLNASRATTIVTALPVDDLCVQLDLPTNPVFYEVRCLHAAVWHPCLVGLLAWLNLIDAALPGLQCRPPVIVVAGL